jgi:hypothetical protein
MAQAGKLPKKRKPWNMNTAITEHFRPISSGPSLISRLPGLIRLTQGEALEKNQRPTPNRPARNERRPRSKTQTEPRIAYSIAEWARMIGATRQTVWRYIRDGQLRTVIVGNRKMIPASELARLKLVEPQE